MLPPDGRAVLVELLRPPPGAELVRGIATTFTLDLTSALTAPLSFASHRLGSGQDPEAVMQAITMASDQLDIFCQAGQLNVPGSPSDLMASLEKMVHPVRSPHAGGLFHPKIWLLEFSDGTETSFRLLCASRNLTSDRSWDVVVRLDGDTRVTPPRGQQAAARPDSRPAHAGQSRRCPPSAPQPHPGPGRARSAMPEWEGPTTCIEVIFHALGVTRRRSSLDFTGNPHLRDLTVRHRRWLCGVSRHPVPTPSSWSHASRTSTGSIPRPSPADRDIRRRRRRGAGPGRRHGDRPQDLLAGLHAKTYVIERGHAARLILGSANATKAAFDGNIEFLVELVGTKSKLGIETFIGPDAPFRQMLADYPAAGGKRARADDAGRPAAGGSPAVTWRRCR